MIFLVYFLIKILWLNLIFNLKKEQFLKISGTRIKSKESKEKLNSLEVLLTMFKKSFLPILLIALVTSFSIKNILNLYTANSSDNHTELTAERGSGRDPEEPLKLS